MILPRQKLIKKTKSFLRKGVALYFFITIDKSNYWNYIMN